MEALKQSGLEAQVEKIEDIEETLKYNVMTTPAICWSMMKQKAA